jgi:hypothetical protein
MKQSNKTKLKIVALVATLLTAVVILSSCEWLKSYFPPPPQVGEKTVAVYIVDAEAVDGILTSEGASYEIQTDAEYVHGFLDELKNQKGVSYKGTDWGTGFFIDEIDGITLGDGFWILVYVRLADDEVIDTFMDEGYSCEYDGKTFYVTKVGVDQIPLFDGIEILFFKIFY